MQRSTNPRVRPILFTQWTKGCFVHVGINQRVYHKVVYIHVLFAKHTYNGPPVYVRTKDRSVCPPNLANIQSNSPNFPSCVLNDPKPKLTPLTKLPKHNYLFGSLQQDSNINVSRIQKGGSANHFLYKNIFFTVLPSMRKCIIRHFLKEWTSCLISSTRIPRPL